MTKLTTAQMIAAIAKAKGLKTKEATDYIVKVAYGRLLALKTWKDKTKSKKAKAGKAKPPKAGSPAKHKAKVRRKPKPAPKPRPPAPKQSTITPAAVVAAAANN